MFQKSDARNWKNIYTVIKTDVIYFHKDKAAAGNETVKWYFYLIFCQPSEKDFPRQRDLGHKGKNVDFSCLKLDYFTKKWFFYFGPSKFFL